MSDLSIELSKRIGAHRIQELNHFDFPLLLLDVEWKGKLQVLMTNGLSDKVMNTPDSEVENNRIELYFCLPSYWDIHDLENENMNWVFHWISRLANYLKNNDTWLGHGHTMQCGAEMKSLSPTMRQNHFILSNPILLEEVLAPIEIQNQTVRFISIIPIFEDEMDYKQGKGTFKFMQKLANKGVTEKLDDFRSTVLKSKWRLIKR